MGPCVHCVLCDLFVLHVQVIWLFPNAQVIWLFSTSKWFDCFPMCKRFDCFQCPSDSIVFQVLLWPINPLHTHLCSVSHTWRSLKVFWLILRQFSKFSPKSVFQYLEPTLTLCEDTLSVSIILFIFVDDHDTIGDCNIERLNDMECIGVKQWGNKKMWKFNFASRGRAFQEIYSMIHCNLPFYIVNLLLIIGIWSWVTCPIVSAVANRPSLEFGT